MREKRKKYLKVLRIELEDLQEDLELMADLYNQRDANAEITPYVFLENVSLLQAEITGIENIIRSIDDIVIDRFETLNELVDYSDQAFQKLTKEAGYPDAVYELVRRKLRKVARYLRENDHALPNA